MTECKLELPYGFYRQRPLVVQFSDLELSSDSGVLLARQAEETVQVCWGLFRVHPRMARPDQTHP
jgi:hypothetical protein